MTPSPIVTAPKEPVGLFPWLRDRFITGLFVAIPISLTVWLVEILYGLINDPSDGLIRLLIKNHYLVGSDYFIARHGGTIPFAGFFFTLLIILGIGILAKNFLGRHLVRWVDRLIYNVPVVKTIYQALQQIVQAFQQFTGSEKQQQFSQVVLIPISEGGTHAMGFLTGRLRNKEGRAYANVFVPTPPNPLNGLLFVVPEDKLVPVDFLTVEQATKMIISLGIITPDHLERYPQPGTSRVS